MKARDLEAEAVIKKAIEENREETEAQRMDPKEGSFEAAPLEDGEEDPPKGEEGGGTTSTANATFSSTTSTLPTSQPQAMSTTKEKGIDKKEDVLYVDDNTPLEALMQPGALTSEFKPSGGASGSMQAVAGEARSSPTTRSCLEETTEERQRKKPRTEDAKKARQNAE